MLRVSRPGREHGQVRADDRHLRAGGRQMSFHHQVEHNAVLVTSKFPEGSAGQPGRYKAEKEFVYKVDKR